MTNLPGNATMWIDHSSSYCSVAYSPTSSRWGRSWARAGFAVSDQGALAECGIGATIVERAHGDFYIALAVASDGGVGTGVNANARYAKRAARNKCTGRDIRIVLVVHAAQGIKEEAIQPATPRDQPRAAAPLIFGYGAIASSAATGLFSHTREGASYAEAEARAIRQLQSQPGTADATACAGFNTFIALARWNRGPGRGFGFSYGRDNDRAEAVRFALSRCPAGTDPDIVLVIHTLGENLIKPS